MMLNNEQVRRMRNGGFPTYNLRGQAINLGEINYGSTTMFTVGLGLLAVAALGAMYYSAKVGSRR